MMLGFVILSLLLAAVSSAQDQPADLHGVLLIDGSRSIAMKDSTASRSGRRGVASNTQYFTFSGPKAAVRTRTAQPEFQYEADPEIDDPAYLFRLDARSDHREIRIAKGEGLTELSIPKDHIIPTRIEVVGKGQNSLERYRMKPTVPLRPGEYCLSRNISVCFDFGVD